jgi:hypothetical protein
MNEQYEFKKWDKMGRLYRPILITEKIDGTNGQINIVPDSEDILDTQDVTIIEDYGIPLEGATMLVGSRKRWLNEQSDNFGFFKWARDNADALAELGPGRHFGEWWGKGIQRGYGKKDRTFSLFNVMRYTLDPSLYKAVWNVGVEVVPLLYAGDYRQAAINIAITDLDINGSKAAPGYDKPEGIVIFHTATNTLFKYTLEGDQHKEGYRPPIYDKIDALQEVIK